MINDTVELMGGESVYCINQSQLKHAFELKEKSESVKGIVKLVEKSLTRNERAAVAFLLIDNLIKMEK